MTYDPVKLTDTKIAMLNGIQSLFGKVETVTRKQIRQVEEEFDLKPPYWIIDEGDEHGRFQIKRGEYRIPHNLLDQPYANEVNEDDVGGYPTPEWEKVEEPKAVDSDVDSKISFIPEVDSDYVKFGHYNDIQSIIKSGIFYPTFITGLSGNGKTFSVEQACAKLGRECVRVNITIETDEDDLLGGFRLVNGETVFHKGPVVDAMERGAVLLLDEVDLASNKILALQPVLEGKGVYLKKINEWIAPKDGFNVIATANTKGKGSESGAFVGTNILNEAFLERFAITLEQDYPPVATEVKIVKNVFSSVDVDDDDFAKKLVDWADIIRKTYQDGGVDEIISTRRLVHIAKAFSIFQNRKKAIELCIARFDDNTKDVFNDLYTKIDDKVVEDVVDAPKVPVSNSEIDTTPFN